MTPEEQALLAGGAIDKSLYMAGGPDIVSSKKLLSAGKLITLRPHTRFVDFPEHTHDFVEMVYMCSGETTHIINGKELCLREGELLFLSQNARQAIRRASANDIAVNLIVLPEFFGATLPLLGEEETPLRKFLVDCLKEQGGGPGYLHFRAANIIPIQNLVENLICILLDDTPKKRNLSQLTMGLLFLQLVNHTDLLAWDDPEEQAVLRLMGYIEEHYRTGSLTEAASLLHYDISWLSREVKKKTGHTYTELLKERRLSQAAYLLKNTDMRVSDISLAVGYENISYFHRCFDTAFGCSPKKYRDRFCK